MKETHVELWERFLAHHDLEARESLLQLHMRLVHDTARRLKNRLPNQVEYEDLVSAGVVGLIKAMDEFDAARGFAFSTYAVPKIEGAIRDDLRVRDPASRSVRKREREVNAVRSRLEQEYGRTPSDKEIADALGIELVVFWRWREAMASLQFQSIDEPTFASGDSGVRLSDVVADEDAPALGADLEMEQDIARLQVAIQELKAQQRLVLTLFFYEGLKQKQIAQALELTEGRVAQVMSEAKRALKAKMAA